MIRFNKPTIIRKDMDAVLQTMVDEKIDPGEKVTEFTDFFSTLIKAKKSFAFRTLIDAIESAYQLAGPGIIGLSPLSSPLYRDIALKTNHQIKIIDIDPETGCVDANEVKKAEIEILVLSEPFACFPIKYNSENMKMEFQDFGDVFIIEDISQSLGCSQNDEILSGKLGDIVICSLEQNSLIATGGGAILSAMKTTFDINMNYKELPDLNASLGTIQIKSLPKRIEKRRSMWLDYYQASRKTSNKCLCPNITNIDINGLGFCLRSESKTDLVIKFAMKYDVPVETPFANCIGSENFDLYPNAIGYILRGVQFPIYPFMTPQEIDKVIKVIGHLP